MLLLHARQAARFRNDELVTLADQDPSLIDQYAITEGRRVLDQALQLGGRGAYVLLAVIASLHADEPRDWRQIAGVYAELFRLTGSPVVELNRAVAVAEVDGPEAALAIVDELPFDGFRYLHATRAELLRRLGAHEEAQNAYLRALGLVHDGAERRHLERRRRTLGGEPPRARPGLRQETP
jgi:RNA polymerase sigma-70 factor (ECF subfamily)